MYRIVHQFITYGYDEGCKILKGKMVDPSVSLTISPGSKQVFNMMAQNGALSDIIESGARILECACGPCVRMGQSPNSAVYRFAPLTVISKGVPERPTVRFIL